MREIPSQCTDKIMMYTITIFIILFANYTSTKWGAGGQWSPKWQSPLLQQEQVFYPCCAPTCPSIYSCWDNFLNVTSKKSFVTNLPTHGKMDLDLRSVQQKNQWFTLAVVQSLSRVCFFPTPMLYIYSVYSNLGFDTPQHA